MIVCLINKLFLSIKFQKIVKNAQGDVFKTAYYTNSPKPPNINFTITYHIKQVLTIERLQLGTV